MTVVLVTATQRPTRSGIDCGSSSAVTTSLRCHRRGSVRGTRRVRRDLRRLRHVAGRRAREHRRSDRLIGHDWAAATCSASLVAPDLIRSWSSDIAGCADPEYVWHDLAQVWQTPGDGEAFVEAMNSMPIDDRVAGFVDAGMTPDVARACAMAAGPEMGRCILALYRSAAQPAMTEWGRELEQAERRPGLVVIPTADQYTGGEVLARRSAERFGADVAILEGLGHWWMLQDPRRGAEALRGFLDALD